MKRLQMVLKLTSILLMTTLLGQVAMAGALCPPDSCNIHNGCMDGCPRVGGLGTASCTDKGYEDAIKEAQGAGYAQALQVCGGHALQYSEWNVQTSAQSGQCNVIARAGFSCVK